MRPVTILLGIVAVLFLANSNANACSCATPRSPCQSYGWSAAVFVGTVVGVSEKQWANPKNPKAVDWTPVTYKFSVEQAYLGVPGTQVEVSTGRGFGDCGYSFQTGKRYLVYAHLHDGRLITSICSRTKLFDAATEDLAFLGTLSSRAPGVTISGEILSNRDGQTKFPSSDMLVTIESEGQRKEVRPNADGDFTVSGIQPGKLKVSLKLPDTLTATEQEMELTVADRGCASVVWYIKHNGQLSGRVVDREGLPVARIWVSLEDAAEPDYSIEAERTDEEGKFTFSGVSPGSYLLAVKPHRYPDPKDPTNAYPPAFYPGVIDRTGARTITVGAAEKVSDLEIQLPPKRPDSIIDGIVVWSDGSPVANALVTVKDITRGESVFYIRNIDRDGRFRLNAFVGQKLVIEARGIRRNAANGTRADAEQVGKVTLTLQRSTEPVRVVITPAP